MRPGALMRSGTPHTTTAGGDDIDSIKVVGLENVCDLGDPGDSALDHARAADELRAKLCVPHGRGSDEPDWRERMDHFAPILSRHLQFLTMDDWLDELGDRREIDGSWMQPRPVSCAAGHTLTPGPGAAPGHTARSALGLPDGDVPTRIIGGFGERATLD